MPRDADELRPEELRLHATRAVHTHLANTGPEKLKRQTEAGRAEQLRRYRLQVDPDGTMDPAERDRRVQHLVKARMAELGLRAVAARRARAAARRTAAVDADLDALAAAESALAES